MAEQTDTLSKYGQSFQTKVLSVLINDSRLLDTLSDIIHKKFFESEANKWIIQEIKNYYLQYKSRPTLDVFKVEISKLTDDGLKKSIIDQLKLIYTESDETDYEYIRNEFTSFCKNQNLKNAIIQSVDLLKTGKYDKIKELVDTAMKVGIESEIGVDYVTDFTKRTTEESRDTVPTGWDCIDDLMDGGLGGGELAVVVSTAGGGKSWCLATIGANAVKAGKTVVHYTLELSEHYVGRRYDTIFTHIPSNELTDRTDEIYSKIKGVKGKLLMKYFPPKGITSKKIESHIEKMIANGYKPDLIIIDYADLLLSHSTSSDSTYLEQGGVYIDLRGLSGELGIPIWTASQAQRSATTTDVIEADKIADSYAKVMNADFIMSLSRKSNDKLNHTGRFHIMKNRFGPDGLTFPSKFDTNVGIIEIYNPSSSDAEDINRKSKIGEVSEREMLHKKYVENMGSSKPTLTSGLG